MKNFLIFLTFLIIASISSLVYYKSQLSRKIDLNFYYWQSTYNVDRNETKPPHYVKVLDIAYGETLVFKKIFFKGVPIQKIVPVIYIDNPLWSKMKAKTMVTKILKSLNSMPIKYDEIQVDCDWTEKSRASYFKFLKALKEESAKRLSVTIRLHQVKYYAQTGVPPVDYGVLMYYNMSDFKDMATKNYILDLAVAKQYHYNFETYPLRLNLALPLYSQATIIRFSQVVGLMEGVREEALTGHFKKIKEHLYRVEKTHYFQKRLFYKGDKVRVDEVTVAMLKKSILLLSDVMKRPKEIIFYRWGNRHQYKRKNLEMIVNSLK